MSKIVKSSDFKTPSITGFVKVSLAEIDNIRVQYAAAINTIQELEGKQMQVKITLNQPTKYVDGYDPYDRPIYKERKNETVIYENLDEVKERIRNEVDEKWRKDVEQLQSEKCKLNAKVSTASKQIAELTEKLTDLAAQNNKLVIENEAGNREVEAISGKLNATITILERNKAALLYLEDKVHKLRQRRSFWYWVTGLFYTPEKLWKE